MAQSSVSAQTSDKTDCIAYALLAAIFIARMIYVNFMGLVGDEAYYWDWSRSPAWGYFDHPPMTAWLIFLGTHIFGTTLLGVKFMAVAGCCAASLFTYFLAKKYVKRTSSIVILLVLSSFVILFGIGGLIATPDIPMVLFWSIALYAAYKAIFENRPWAWLLLGLSMGCGLLSKYLFGLFIISLFVFLVYSKEHRRILLSGRFIGALTVAALMIAPNLCWNSRHQWISVMYQMHHGVGGEAFPRFDFLGEFIGGQIGMLSIFPFILLVISIIKELRFHGKKPKRLFISVFCLTPLIFFTLSSLQKRVEPNWPCGAYVSGLMLIAFLWEETVSKGLRRFILFSTGMACAATVIILIHVQSPILPLASGNDPTNQLRGWKQWAMSIDGVRKNIDPNAGMPLCTKFYQEAAFLSFYLPDHPITHALSVNSRPSQYSLLESSAGIYGKKAIIIIPCADSLLPPEFSSRVENPAYVGLSRRPLGGERSNLYGVFTAIVKPQP